jgi:hypothetical protein
MPHCGTSLPPKASNCCHNEPARRLVAKLAMYESGYILTTGNSWLSSIALHQVGALGQLQNRVHQGLFLDRLADV